MTSQSRHIALPVGDIPRHQDKARGSIRDELLHLRHAPHIAARANIRLSKHNEIRASARWRSTEAVLSSRCTDFVVVNGILCQTGNPCLPERPSGGSRKRAWLSGGQLVGIAPGRCAIKNRIFRAAPIECNGVLASDGPMDLVGRARANASARATIRREQSLPANIRNIPTVATAF
jgi:hypothetical protein